MWTDFLKTLVIEIPILWLFVRKYDHWPTIAGLGILINASTWMFLTYYYYKFGGNIFFLEILVAIAEALWIRNLWPISWIKSFMVGFLTNVVSFGLGWWGLI